MKKLLYFTAFLMFTTIAVEAQKVIRKGTTPLMRGQNPKDQKADYVLDQFQGKWQEISRTTLKGKSAMIKDTIYLYFYEDNKADTREGNKPTLQGDADIDNSDNTIIAAGDQYEIKSVNESTLVLDDQDKFIHTFKKVDKFWYDKVGNLSVGIDTFKTVIEYDPANLLGDWMVYRRQAKPGEVKPPATLFKYLKIQKKVDASTLTGEVTVYQKEKSQELPCTITLHKTGIQVTAGANSWYLPIYKADGKELVFGNVELMLNYCKPL